MNDLCTGADGLRRCGWAGEGGFMADYHDTEWGYPLHGDQALYERLCLEAFQSGLSWALILRKREAFRVAFCGFDPVRVAAFTEGDQRRLLEDAGIVRNRAKIAAAVNNARAVVALDEPLDELLWSFAPSGPRRRPRTFAEVPAVTDESKALSRELKRRGFAFVGPTTGYALMQATGMVDDHLRGCHRAVAAEPTSGRTRS